MIKQLIVIVLTIGSMQVYSSDNHLRNKFFQKDSVAVIYGEILYLSQACNIPHYQEIILNNRPLFESIYKIQIQELPNKDFNSSQQDAYNKMKSQFLSSKDNTQESTCIEFNYFLINNFQNSLTKFQKKYEQ